MTAFPLYSELVLENSILCTSWLIYSIHLKHFTPIHIPKALLKNFLCSPETTIYGPGPSRKYTGLTNIVDALGLISLSAMALAVFPRALFTMVDNNVSNLSMRNAYGGISFPTFSLLFPGKKIFGVELGLYVVLQYWGSVVKSTIILCQFHSCFQNYIYTSKSTFCHPKSFESKFISCCCVIVKDFPQCP